MPVRLIPAGRLSGLDGPDRGLTSHEVAERTQAFGPNHILEAPPHPWRGVLRDSLRDPMLWFFGGTAALYWATGQVAEAVALGIAIVPLFGMDLFLHQRTQASTRGLRSRLSTEALVLRDQKEVTIPAAELVPGDLVLLRPGDFVPADGLIVDGYELQFEESILTGEAYAAKKTPVSDPVDGVRVDEQHWAFAGTRFLTGRARMRVVFTGPETLYGQIVQTAIAGTHESTPLQAAIGRLVRQILVVALMACIALAAVRLRQGHDWLDAVLSAATLGATAIPEEFPVAFTFLLGVGVFRLAKRQVLVRRAVAVENIGRITVICSDKTGTLTEGRLEWTHTLVAAGIAESQLRESAVIAARADSGDPMDQAILALQTPSWERVASFPFTEARRRETGIVTKGGARVAAVKGAVEVVLASCDLPDAERRQWLERAATLAGEAHKVIAVASRELQEIGEEPLDGFTFLGLLAFEDPVRTGAREAITQCTEAGIRTILVTGDHPATAAAVARELGLGGEHPCVVLADELTQSSTPLREVHVIARAKPAQKLDLVNALRRQGEIVAVTGDGVNDVPALQAADIGIAMGERGTRSAREVAAIVLLDDNFRTIVAAIAEGRQLFLNLQLSFEYLLLIHIPLVLTATAVPLLGFPLLYLPIHIAWLEVVIHPTAMLVFQSLPTEELLPREPQPPRGHFFGRRQLLGVIGGGLVLAAGVGAGFLHSLTERGGVPHGRAMALALLLCGSASMAGSLSRLQTAASRWVCGLTLLTTVVLVQWPEAGRWLELEPLHLDDWSWVLLLNVLLAGIVRQIAHRK